MHRAVTQLSLLSLLLASLLAPSAADAKRSWKKIRRGIQRHLGSQAKVGQRLSSTKAGKAQPKVRWQTGGGVVLDLKGKRVLLIQSKKERGEGTNGWTLPKGKVDAGESPRVAARRETLEETAGLRAQVVGKIGSYRSSSALRHYFLMTADAKQVKKLEDRVHRMKKLPRKRRSLDPHGETMNARWVSLKEASKLLDRGRDRQVLKATKRMLDDLERLGAKQ